MIADSEDILPALLPSIWENEEPISSYPPTDSSVFSENFEAESLDDVLVARMNDGNHHLVSQFSMQSSVTSSECGSDDLYTEICTDFDNNLLRLSENLTSPLFSGCDENEPVFTSERPAHYDNGITGCTSSSDAASDIIIPSVSCSPATSPVQKRKSGSSSSSNYFDCSMQRWTEMTSFEQLSVVQDLTEVVSQQMGLREQLEVIRIINPTANVSPTDTEFVIDLERLNDEKLQEVRSYIKKFKCSKSDSSALKEGMNDTCSECSSSGLTPSKNTPRKKQRRQSKENHSRQRKHRRQELKEKKSGLFEKEEVLSLQMPEQSAEVDIDILT